jgi:hypothetical protein
MRSDSPPPRTDGTHGVASRMRAREAGLRLARRVQYGIAAVAIGAAGGLAALTARAYHARAAAAPRPAPAHRASAPSPRDESDNGTGSTAPAVALQPPATVPSPAPAINVAPVVSGGS